MRDFVCPDRFASQSLAWEMLRLPHVAQDMQDMIGVTVARLWGGPGRRISAHCAGQGIPSFDPARDFLSDAAKPRGWW